MVRREVSKGDASLYVPSCHAPFQMVDGLTSICGSDRRSKREPQSLERVSTKCNITYQNTSCLKDGNSLPYEGWQQYLLEWDLLGIVLSAMHSRRG